MPSARLPLLEFYSCSIVLKHTPSRFLFIFMNNVEYVDNIYLLMFVCLKSSLLWMLLFLLWLNSFLNLWNPRDCMTLLAWTIFFFEDKCIYCFSFQFIYKFIYNVNEMLRRCLFSLYQDIKAKRWTVVKEYFTQTFRPLSQILIEKITFLQNSFSSPKTTDILNKIQLSIVNAN